MVTARDTDILSLSISKKVIITHGIDDLGQQVRVTKCLNIECKVAGWILLNAAKRLSIPGWVVCNPIPHEFDRGSDLRH
jgi:hypothetical protein